MPVYVYERIHILGGGRGKFVEMVRRHWADHAEEAFGVRLLGIWATVGSTAHWPETVMMWEMRDWNHFADAYQAQFPLETKDPFGYELWRQALQWRSGGEGIPLVNALQARPGNDVGFNDSPSMVVLQENIEAKPGRLAAYHQAMEVEYIPTARSAGITLLGAYKHAFSPNLGINLWGISTWNDVQRIMESTEIQNETEQWHQRTTEFLVDTGGWLLAALPRSRLGT